LWDQGGADRSLTNEQNFLGEVILNLSKLGEFDGVVVDQEFDLRAGHHTLSPRPLGKLNMKLKYMSGAVVRANRFWHGLVFDNISSCCDE